MIAPAAADDVRPLIDVVISVFNLLFTHTILGIPLLIWFLIPVIFGFIFDLVKERKNKE